MDDLAQQLESLGAGGMAQPTAAPSLTLTAIVKFWVPWRRELTAADTLLSGEATMTTNNNSGPWFCGLSLPGNVKSSDLSSPRQKCCAAPGAIALKMRSDNPRTTGHEGENVLSLPHPQILASLWTRLALRAVRFPCPAEPALHEPCAFSKARGNNSSSFDNKE